MRFPNHTALGALCVGAALLVLPSCFGISHDYVGPREITPGTKLSQPSEKLGDIKGDKKAIFSAASKARQACEYLYRAVGLEPAPEPEAAQESQRAA